MIRFIEDGILLQRPSGCSTLVYHLILGCWRLDPGARFSFERLHRTVEEYLTNLTTQQQSQQHRQQPDDVIGSRNDVNTAAEDAAIVASGDELQETANTVRDGDNSTVLDLDDVTGAPSSRLRGGETLTEVVTVHQEVGSTDSARIPAALSLTADVPISVQVV